MKRSSFLWLLCLPIAGVRAKTLVQEAEESPIEKLDNQQDFYGNKPVSIYRKDVETGKEEAGLLVPMCFRDEGGSYFTHYETFVYRRDKMVRVAQDTVPGIDLYAYISDNNKAAETSGKGFTIGAHTADPTYWSQIAAPMEMWQKKRGAQRSPVLAPEPPQKED